MHVYATNARNVSRYNTQHDCNKSVHVGRVRLI